MLKLSLTAFIKRTLRAVQRKTTNGHFSFIHKLGKGKSEESRTMGRNDSNCKGNKKARGSNMTLLPFFRLKIQTQSLEPTDSGKPAQTHNKWQE